MSDLDLGENISALLVKYRSLQTTIMNTKSTINNLDKQYTDYKNDLDVISRSKPIIDDIINKFSESLISKLEDLLTLGLKKIFYDRDYTLKIKVSDKRNSKCAELYLIEDNNTIQITRSTVAGGILVVIASIIQIFYITNLNVDKFIFLDEQFSQISEQYIENFMAFISQMCQDTGLSLVLITHDNKFIPYGDRIYCVEKGKFILKQ